jgi:RimJ/RimL family protein N-acetyltransferase
MSDAFTLFEWKNETQTRKYAIVTHVKIKAEDHINWLEKRLKKGKYYIIEVQDKTVGSLRLEPDEIVINIDKKFRKRGIATEVLESIKTRPLYVKIVDDNLPSMVFYIKRGFLPYKREKGYYVFIQQ